MAFDINDFKFKGLKYGGTRPSLFQVVVYPPPGVVIQAAGIEKFPFVCRAADLPESTIGNIDIPYFGRKIKVAGDRTFADWSVTIMNDEDFAVRSMFEAWHNSINSIVSNLRLAKPEEDYKTVVDVVQYAKDGEAIRAYQLVGAFPTTVSNISLGWESTNAIEEFTVTFAYDYWVPVSSGTTILSPKTSGQVTEYDVEASPSGGPVGI